MMEPETIAAPGYPTAEHESFYRRTLLPSGLHAHTVESISSRACTP